MGVLVTVAAAEPWIELDDAKAHLRVTTADEDDLIEAYIAAACAWIDGPQGWVGRCFGAQTLELQTDAFANPVRLPIGPVSSITSIRYVDPSGDEAECAADLYTLHDGAVSLVAGQRWPSLRGDVGGVRIRFTAGQAEVPTPVRQAALLVIGQWFRNRMAVNVGNIVNEMPNGVKALLGPYRVIRV